MIIRVIQHRLQVQTRREDAAGCYKKKIILYILKMYNTCNTVRSVYYVFMKLPYKNTQFVISDYSCSCLRVRSHSDAYMLGLCISVYSLPFRAKESC